MCVVTPPNAMPTVSSSGPSVYISDSVRMLMKCARCACGSLPPASGEAVLDVATGPGTVARQAAALVGPSGRVVGVDISAAMLGVARSFAVEQGAGSIEYVEAL